MRDSKEMVILAIETSCDETGIAVLAAHDERIEVLASELASQVDIHRLTGGVVPEAAAREHVAVIKPLLDSVLAQAASLDEVTHIAVTVGPGLQPALAVGVQAARILSYRWQIPLVPVHHIEGHIYSALLNTESGIKNQESSSFIIPTSNVFPVLALIVSGGHTLLVHLRDHVQYEVVGTTRDDAAGEAFDKVARLLGLPYPGGPVISELARQGKQDAYAFPRPMLDSGDFDFSFSGLKTAVLYTWRDIPAEHKQVAAADVAASFEQAVVDTLVHKTCAAAVYLKPTRVLLAGGVAANFSLRRQLAEALALRNLPLHIAPTALCGDNAIMIGLAGAMAAVAGRHAPWLAIDAHARLDLARWAT